MYYPVTVKSEIKEKYLEDVKDQQRSTKEKVKIKKKKRKKLQVQACVSSCKYDLVKQTIEKAGFRITSEESRIGSLSNLIWADCIIQCDAIQELKDYQKINHFPNMGVICRKDSLARNMAKMKRACGEEYNFTPRSWILPSEFNTLLLYSQDMRKSKKKVPVFIHKPSNGAMGHGISLFRNPEKINIGSQMVVQEYLNKPLLWDGYKIDLRIYVLVTNCDPLRIFLYQDGLVRLSTEKYSSASEKNLDQLYMHLTNYSVNKTNENFERHNDMDRGSKRSVKSLMKHLSNDGHDTVKVWRDIADLVVKTLIVASPEVSHAYRMCRPNSKNSKLESVCFEVLGFDIFLDRRLKPWLLEVNRAPSFGGDERIDREIKTGVINDALVLVNIKASDRRKKLAFQKAETQRRLFKSNTNHQQQHEFNLNNKTEKNKLSITRRKKELKDQLAWIRAEAAREEYEDDHLGNYVRVFPCLDVTRKKMYTDMLKESFRLFHHIQSTPFQKSIIDYYDPKNEDELLSMIEKCEAEEGTLPPKTSKQLRSMPSVLTSQRKTSSSSSSSSSDNSEDEDYHDRNRYEVFRRQKLLLKNKLKRSPSTHERRKSPFPNARPAIKNSSDNKDINELKKKTAISPQNVVWLGTGDVSNNEQEKLENLTRKISKKLSHEVITSNYDVTNREQENVWRTLEALRKTTIKFPGKSDSEASILLKNLIEKWSEHKQKIAHYWLVQLDSVKRKKVIEIVEGNVEAVVQKVWKFYKLDSLKLSRLFCKIFNRMLWNRGQGLWQCFDPEKEATWEIIFKKSSDVIKEEELECCRRIVELCKDCLLIVYQFANETKRLTGSSNYKSNKLAAPRQLKSREITSSFTSLPRRFTRLYTPNSTRRLLEQQDRNHLITPKYSKRYSLTNT